MVKNETFKSGETLNFKIYYNWGKLWLSAGEASFSVSSLELNKRTFYHFVGIGSTYPKYDWFYKVRDKYESYADTSNLKPSRFIREADEGGNFVYDDYIFNYKRNKVHMVERRGKKAIKIDSITFEPCTYDVMTAIYFARSLDFTVRKQNDNISITFALDGKIYGSYIHYLGKEIISNDLLGNVRCIKFKIKLIEGTIFKGGEEMTVWITDDKNKMPVYVETPIIVGSIKVKLINYNGLRNPIESVISK